MSEDDARHTPDPSHAQEHDGLDEMIDTLRELVTLERERLNVAPRLAEVALPDALLRLADALGDAERYEEALAVGDEAVARWTALREDPGERGPQFPSRCARRLAEALYLQSYYLDELGRYEAAREAAERELALRHELARAGADDGRYDLAAAYNNLSNALQGLERDADELAARREALALRRALAQENFEEHGEELAQELERLSGRARDWGHLEAALTTQREAVETWRALVELDTDVERELASALDDLAQDHFARGELEEALARARESVARYDELAGDELVGDSDDAMSARARLEELLLAADRPEAALPRVHDTLARGWARAEVAPVEQSGFVAAAASRLFEALDVLERDAELLARADELDARARALAERHATVEGRVALALLLELFSEALRARDRYERALVSADAGVALLRAIDAPDDRARARLSKLLRERGISLTELARHEDALACSSEAVELLRALAEPEPLVLAEALRDLRHDLAELGRHEDALAAVEESLAVLRALPEDDEVRADLADALVGMRACLTALGRHEDAALALREALAAHERALEVDVGEVVATLLKLRSELNALGRADEAMEAVREALERCRALADPVLLATVLDALADELQARDMTEEAAATRWEGLGLLEHLEDDDDDDDDELLELRLTLTLDLSFDLLVLGRHAEALPRAREALELIQRPAFARVEPDPTQRRVELVDALANACDALRGLGRYDEALPRARELVEHRRALVEQLPEDELPNLIDDLEREAVILMALGRARETAALLEEAETLRARLTSDPGAG